MTQSEPPFGTYKLNPIREIARKNAEIWRRRFPLVGAILKRIVGYKTIKGPVDVMPYGNAKVRLYPEDNVTDKFCFRVLGIHILGEGLYEEIENITKKCTDDVMIYVDIGANTGLYSIVVNHAAQKHNQKIQTVAIEPNPKLVQRMKFNFDNSGLKNNTQIFQYAISDTEKELTLDTSLETNLGAAKITTKNQTKTKNMVKVKAKYLTSILKDAGVTKIDFLKIDVEGHEVQALKPFFENAPQNLMPKYILAEMIHGKGDRLQKLFQNNGYKVKQIFDDDTLFVRKT